METLRHSFGAEATRMEEETRGRALKTSSQHLQHNRYDCSGLLQSAALRPVGLFVIFFFASFAQINCICLALASSWRRGDGGGELAGDFIYRHLFPRRVEGAPSAGAQPPLQFTRDDLSRVIYIRLPSPRRPTCARSRSRSLSFSIGFIYFLSTLPLCLLQQSAFFRPLLLPRPRLGTL